MTTVHGKTIVIVEDDDAIRDSLTFYFGSRSKVHDYESAEAMLADQASIANPDVFIIDYKLPGINGVDLFQQLRGLYTKSKYILITGEMNYDLAERTRELGLDALILKPFDFRILEDNISGLVSNAT